MSLPSALEIDGEIYEPVPDEVRVAVAYLLRIKERLGIPEDVELEGTEKTSSRANAVLLKYAFEVYKVWASLFPHEHLEFVSNTEFELKYERPVKEALKQGGYSPVSFPARLDQLYKVLIPTIKTQDKRFWMPFISMVPELKRTNYIK